MAKPPAKEPPRQRITLYLPEGTIRALREAAEEYKMSRNDLVVWAVRTTFPDFKE